MISILSTNAVSSLGQKADAKESESAVEDNQQRCASVAAMAKILATTANSLNKQRSLDPDAGPPFFRMGRKVLYPLHGPLGFDGWMSARIAEGASHE
jgi:hypothetical protein